VHVATAKLAVDCDIPDFLIATMDGSGLGERHIIEWDESDVHAWLSSLGYPQYESQIRGPLISHPRLLFLNITLQNITSRAMCYVCWMLNPSRQWASQPLAKD
jgi:hypothetical protein